MIDAFDEGEEFLKSRFGARWDSPKAQFRKNYAHFLYTHAKQPKKGFDCNFFMCTSLIIFLSLYFGLFSILICFKL